MYAVAVISRTVPFAKYHVVQCKEVGGDKRITEMQDKIKNMRNSSHQKGNNVLHNIGHNTGAKRNTGDISMFAFAMCLLVDPADAN